jgi:hypothetical protein
MDKQLKIIQVEIAKLKVKPDEMIVFRMSEGTSESERTQFYDLLRNNLEKNPKIGQEFFFCQAMLKCLL